jgi:hypothetical protein
MTFPNKCLLAGALGILFAVIGRAVGVPFGVVLCINFITGILVGRYA